MSPQTGPEERKRETPSCPLASIVIPLSLLQVGRNQCGLASAVLRSALCSSALELWARLLLAAHRFSRDPEHGLPQRLANVITTFSQLCSEKPTLTHQPTANPAHQKQPLTSFLISEIMGNQTFVSKNPLRFMDKQGHELGGKGTVSDHSLQCSHICKNTQIIQVVIIKVVVVRSKKFSYFHKTKI